MNVSVFYLAKLCYWKFGDLKLINIYYYLKLKTCAYYDKNEANCEGRNTSLLLFEQKDISCGIAFWKHIFSITCLIFMWIVWKESMYKQVSGAWLGIK